MLENITKDIRELNLEQVKQLQTLLNKCGYNLDVDGIVSAITLSAFNHFKKGHNLTHPNILGDTTLQFLKRYSEQSLIINQESLNLIKEFEGFRAFAYLCPAGVATIGYGSTFYPDGRRVKLGDHITKEQGEQLLLTTVRGFAEGVKKSVKVPLTNNQFGALVSFAFNVGMGAFNQSTLLRELNKGNYQEVGNQLMRWNRANGKILVGLTRRRKAETNLFYS